MDFASPMDRPHGPGPLPGSDVRSLPIGEFVGNYEVRGVIGEGPVGVLYRASSPSLPGDVALEEFLPAGIAGRGDGTSAVVVVGTAQAEEAFDAGLNAFLDETRLLSRMACPSLIEVHDHWQANQTAYRTMPLVDSPSLRTALAELGRLPSEGELRVWLRPLLEGLSRLHSNGVWHQNLSLDSIALTPRGALLLGMDRAGLALAEFGAAASKLPMSGFAAIEQYGSAADTTRGPWTDFYALAAVVYAAITGTVPPSAADRLSDDRLQPLTVLAAGLYAHRFLAGIDAALAVQPDRRPQDHLQFRAAIGEIDAPWQASPESALPYDPMHEPFLSAARPSAVDVAAGTAIDTGAESGEHRPAGPVARLAEVATASKPAAAAAGAAAPFGQALQASHPAPTPAQAMPPQPPQPLHPPQPQPISPSQEAVRAAAVPSPMPSRPQALPSTPAPLQSARMRPAAAGRRPLLALAAVAGLAVTGSVAAMLFMAKGSGSTDTVDRSTGTNGTNDRSAVVDPRPAGGTAAAAAVTASTGARAASAPPAATVIAPPTAAAPAPPEAKVAAPTERPSAATPSPTFATVPIDIDARCTEILQKASLEAISKRETEFYKTRCK